MFIRNMALPPRAAMLQTKPPAGMGKTTIIIP